MRWPPWKRRNGAEGRHRKGEGVDVNDSPDLSRLAKEAERASSRADKVLQQAKDRAPEVRQVSMSLQYLHNRNQFAEMMIMSLKRKGT